MNKRILVRGTMASDGILDPTPTVVTINEYGDVIGHAPLSGHEPSATIFNPELLLHLLPSPHLA